MSNKDFHKEELYDGYILGSLSAEDEDQFEEHLLFCERCRKEIEMREAFAAGIGSDEKTYPTKIVRRGLSQKGIIIRLSIAASVIIIAGYSLYRIITPQDDIRIATQEESAEEVSASVGESKEKFILSDSIPMPDTQEPSIDFLSEAFIPSPMFENAIENQVRSEGLSIISPVNSRVFKTNDKIEFHWKYHEEQLTLVIFNNKGDVVFESSVGSPFTLTDKFQPGLYYWQLETDDEAIQTLKFIVQ